MNKIHKSRRNFMLTAAGFVGGAVLSLGASKARANPLEDVIKRLLYAALAGIAIYFAWRYIMRVYESLEQWIDEHTENEEEKTDKHVLLIAKDTDAENFGTYVVENAELLAEAEPNSAGCETPAVQKLTRTRVQDNRRESAKHFQQTLEDTLDNASVETLRRKVPQVYYKMDTDLDMSQLLGGKGYINSQSAYRSIQLLMGELVPDADIGNIKRRGANTRGSSTAHVAQKLFAKSVWLDMYSRRNREQGIAEELKSLSDSEYLKQVIDEMAQAEKGLSAIDLMTFDVTERTQYNEQWHDSMSTKMGFTPLVKEWSQSQAQYNFIQMQILEVAKQNANADAMIELLEAEVAQHGNR